MKTFEKFENITKKDDTMSLLGTKVIKRRTGESLLSKMILLRLRSMSSKGKAENSRGDVY